MGIFCFTQTRSAAQSTLLAVFKADQRTLPLSQWAEPTRQTISKKYSSVSVNTDIAPLTWFVRCATQEHKTVDACARRPAVAAAADRAEYELFRVLTSEDYIRRENWIVSGWSLPEENLGDALPRTCSRIRDWKREDELFSILRKRTRDCQQ